MFYNDGMSSCRDDVDINITNQNVNANMNDNMNYNEGMGGGYAMPMQAMGNMMGPIVEPGRERVVNRTFVHEVPQE